MNQIKIGIFIANLRKEQEMTQKQLAERIGVSDKTVSKWECGNGLPEMSSIPILCEALGINMNELLSGERLAEEAYPQKAEENMMTLMKETEEHKKQNRNSLLTLILCLVGIVLILALSMCLGTTEGVSVFAAFLDIPSLLMIVLPTLFVLAAAGLFKAFFKAFLLLGSGYGRSTKQEIEKSRRALRLGANSVLITGMLMSMAAIVFLLGDYRHGMLTELLLANIAVALLTAFYGIVAYLLLLPIRSRLEEKTEE